MKLAAWQSRAVAVVLAVAVCTLAYRVVGLPAWQAHTRNRDAIVEHETQIARFARIVTSGERLRAELGELRSGRDLRRYTLAQSTTTLAAAALQERVKRVIEQSGGRLTSTQVLSPEPREGLRQVAINVRMSVDTPTLQQIFYELEADLPLLFVEELMIIARRARGTRSDNRNRSSLDVRFQLSGFMPSGGDGAG